MKSLWLMLVALVGRQARPAPPPLRTVPARKVCSGVPLVVFPEQPRGYRKGDRVMDLERGACVVVDPPRAGSRMWVLRDKGGTVFLSPPAHVFDVPRQSGPATVTVRVPHDSHTARVMDDLYRRQR